MFGTLPTGFQSSPRAELYSLLAVLLKTEGNILVFSDYLPVVRNFRKSKQQIIRSKSTMLDIWVQVWDRLESRPGQIDLRWTKSHPTQAQAESMQLSSAELLLNRAADLCAHEGAERGKLSSDDVATVSEADHLQEKVLLRLLAIQREVFLTCGRDTSSREGLTAARKKAGVTAGEARRRRLIAAGHSVVERSTLFKCQRCRQSFPKKG
eukprot:2529320-Pyramimonas_sp.AAC.1